MSILWKLEPIAPIVADRQARRERRCGARLLRGDERWRALRGGLSRLWRRFVSASAEEILNARRIMVSANGLDFETFEAGEGERLALLLHGFPLHAVSWRHQVPFLASLGYRVWAVNQRGYGGSSRPSNVEDYTLEKLTGDVAGLIDASGAKSVALFGHDWGGFIAWVFAIRRIRPLDRLVVFNIPHPMCFRHALERWGQKLKSSYIWLFQIPIAPDWLLSVWGGVLPAFMLRHDARRGAFPQDVLNIYRANLRRPGAATAMLNWYRAAGRELLKADDLAAPVEAPTLIVWGEKDIALELSTLDGTERYVRDLRIERLPNVSHWTLEDAPEEVNRRLKEFL
jgi:pimeloyl-ACP methyl ester carboxylesterase